MTSLDRTPDPPDPERRGLARPLGEILIGLGCLDETGLHHALLHQADWGCRIGETLVAAGAIDESALARALAQQLALPLLEHTFPVHEAEQVQFEEAEFYSGALILPWPDEKTGLIYAAVDPTDALGRLRQLQTAPFSLVLTTKTVLLAEFERRFQTLFGLAARDALYQAAPHYSARTGLSTEQKPVVGGLAAALGLSLVAAPIETLTEVGVAGALGFSVTLCLRLAVSAMAFVTSPRTGRFVLDTRSLPIYTVLVPLYREAEGVGGLIAALSALRYPALWSKRTYGCDAPRLGACDEAGGDSGAKFAFDDRRL